MSQVDAPFWYLGGPNPSRSPTYGLTPAEIVAGVTPSDLSIPTEPWYDIKRYGAKLSNTSAQNLAALNKAILVAQNSPGAASLNGVLIFIPADCHYGYDFLVSSTWPQINSGTVPIIVFDYSQGDTYDDFPTRYDGMQERRFYYTPQTTSPGQHNGNGLLINGGWFPYFQTSVNVANAVPSINSYDNLRAGFITAWQQRSGWSIAQGSLSGAGFTPAQMLNFFIQQGPAAQAQVNFTGPLGSAATSATFASAATLYTDASGKWLGYSSPVPVQFSDGQIRTAVAVNGSSTITFPALTGSGQTNITLAALQLSPLIIDYLTLNWIVGVSGNDATQANYHFKAPVDGLSTFLIESLSDPCSLVLRDQVGSANDVAFKNSGGIPSVSPAQSSGWGTPTGASVQNNFSGSGATLAQTSAAVAQLIVLLKSFGLLAA